MKEKIYCDFCSGKSIGAPPRPMLDSDLAVVDGPTRFGPWAYMCQRHLESAGYPGSKMNHWLTVEPTKGDTK